ncbi:uncharacterized protein PV06_09932 [Exophiala oligosperma]|uniref:SGNH domain-containing protein n=1 Tax=Exophiala oligosperma TaxID=215243 RepID=A0A0D2DQ56_9EURO|nr:uncharacterized protein PV06_09932 [Exophiala oligosperma]KIW37954.1 hypothetical protein PV06_09932 [Exophiala oligosperma]
MVLCLGRLTTQAPQFTNSKPSQIGGYGSFYYHYNEPSVPSCRLLSDPSVATNTAAALVHPPPSPPDTFADYKFRNHTSCQISSLELHSPSTTALCRDRDEFLQAFSGGGRIGFDSPYIPRGCDMRWFSTEEVCQILSRYEKVVVVGDSMMRHVVGAMNVLLRQDLGYGAVTDWNFNEDELRDCFCNHQMDVKSCSVQGIFSTSSVLEHDPSSLACPTTQPVDLVIEMMLKFPLDSEELARFRSLLSPKKPRKPYAFIFGHGLWNDLDLQASMQWLDGILGETVKQAPYYVGGTNKKGSRGAPFWPRLFVTPNAAGIQKPDQWLVSQGNKALMVFEESVRVEAGKRGVETMGTWNMSIQASKYDGVHLDLKGNLIKAMGVLNWLAMQDVDTW